MKSRTGYFIIVSGCPISWNSKLHTEIVLVTTEAEYITLSQAMQEIISMRHLILEIATVMKLGGGETAVIKSTVFEENNGTLNTSNAINMTPHTKHIGVKYHFFKHHCAKSVASHS